MKCFHKIASAVAVFAMVSFSAQAQDRQCLQTNNGNVCHGDRVWAPDPFWDLPQVEKGRVIAVNLRTKRVVVDYDDYNRTEEAPGELVGIAEGCTESFCVGDRVSVQNPTIWRNDQESGTVVAVLADVGRIDVDLDRLNGDYRFDEWEASPLIINEDD